MKKLLILIFIALIMLSTVGCFSLLFGDEEEDIWINSDMIYYNKEEIEDLFFEYREDFIEVAEIVLSNEEHIAHMKKTGNNEIVLVWDEAYYEEDDWNKICSLIRNAKLRGLVVYAMDEKKGEGAVLFSTINPEEDQPTISICYISKNGNEPSIMGASFSKIEDNWYILKQKSLKSMKDSWKL